MRERSVLAHALTRHLHVELAQAIIQELEAWLNLSAWRLVS